MTVAHYQVNDVPVPVTTATPMPVVQSTATYLYPDGVRGDVVGTVRTYLSDDFGGVALDTTKWTAIPGGQGAVTLASGAAQQAIGSGVSTGMSSAVASSGLTISTGTTNLAEYWVVSNQTFAGSEDLTILFSKSQASSTNVNFWIGFVECDTAGNVLLNTAFTYVLNGFNEFTNRGGVELGTNALGTFLQLECLGDNSASFASQSSTTFAATAFNSAAGEITVEFNAEDVIASYSAADALTGKTSTALRVSTQCPNDTKLYKLLIRARTSTGAAAQSFTISRILVVDSSEARVEIKSGRGDTVVGKGLAVNVANVPSIAAVGGLNIQSSVATGGIASTRIVSTAVSVGVKGGTGRLFGYDLLNTTASTVYLHFYNKNNPVLSTDTPIVTVALGANQSRAWSSDVGIAFSTYIYSYATTDNPVIPTTAAAAGAIVGTVFVG